MARLFNGTTDKILVSSSLANLTSSWTVAAWVRRASTSRIDPIWSRWTNSTTARELFFYFTAGTDNNKLQLDVPFIAAILTGSTAITDTNWHHCVARRDGNVWSLFLDGVVDGSVTDSTAQENGATLELGYSAAFPGGAVSLSGSLAEEAGWDIALTDSEIKALARGSLPSSIRRQSLAGYWPLRGLSSPEPEFSGAGFNGTLTGTSFSAHPPVDLSTYNRTNISIPENEVTLSQLLTLGQSVTWYKPTQTISQSLTFGQNLNKSLSTGKSNTLGFVQSVSVIHAIPVVADSTLGVSQSVSSETSNNAVDSLSLAQSVGVSKIVECNVQQTLALTQTVSRLTNYTLSVNDSLVFQHTYQKPTLIQGILITVPVPEVLITKVRNRVSFRTQDRAIILLPPELNDGEGGTGKIVLQRTITGGTFTYARRTSMRRLKYVFETDQFKYLEMRRFILDCLSEPIWLENWKGEIWAGYITNNPVEFKSVGRGHPCGDRYTFDVEFEGTRIH